TLDQLVFEIQSQLEDRPALSKLRENLLNRAIAGLERFARAHPDDAPTSARPAPTSGSATSSWCSAAPRTPAARSRHFMPSPKRWPRPTPRTLRPGGLCGPRTANAAS